MQDEIFELQKVKIIGKTGLQCKKMKCMRKMTPYIQSTNDSSGPGFSIKKCMYVNCPTPPLQNYINLKGLSKTTCGVNDTTCTKIGNKKVEFLREYKSVFKKSV
jgi:hypothetical protein